MTCIIDLNFAGQSFNTLRNLQASLSENLSDVLMISCSGGSRPSDKGAGFGVMQTPRYGRWAVSQKIIFGPLGLSLV